MNLIKPFIRIVIAGVVAVAMAHATATNTTQVTADANFSGTVTQVQVQSGNAPLLLQGAGTLGIFGKCGLYVDVEQGASNKGAVNIRFFNIGTGGQNQDSTLPILYADTGNATRTVPQGVTLSESASGTADIASGTGIFMNANGSFPFKITITAGAIGAAITFTLTGTVTINLDTAVQPPAQILSNANDSPVTFNLAVLLGTSINQYYYTTQQNDGNGTWLTITSQNPESTPPLTQGTATGTANPNGMSPGVYQGTVDVTGTPSTGGNGQVHILQSAANPTGSMAVTLIVPAAAQLVVSQIGLSFQNVAGSPLPESQTVSVSSSGAALAFTATASTLTGGAWLSVTPANGSASAAAPVSVSIAANPSGLAAGTYSGRVDFAAASAGNSPQSVYVVLTVLAGDMSIGPLFAPSGLIFVAAAGSNPAAQTITISSQGSQIIAIASQLDALNPWFSVSPANGNVTQGQSLVQSVSVNTSGLAPGVYEGGLSEQASATVSYLVPVVLIVTPAGACSPARLVTVPTNLADKFAATAGSPQPLQAQVLNDCGVPLTAGSVIAAFSTGDAPVTMLSTGAGNWAGTWMPHNIGGGVASVTITANSTSALAGASAVTAGAVAENDSVPMMAAVSPVVSGASFAAGQPLAPGTFVTIFGPNLGGGSGPGTVATAPYPPALAGVQVLMGAEPLPLYYVGAQQINAIVPWDVPVNATVPLAVQFDGVASMPVAVVTAAASPAVFTQDESGAGLGSIVVVKTNGTIYVASASNTASAGDVLEVYCVGLGAVQSPPPAGATASTTTLSRTILPVTATVGGIPATVSFSGLAPGNAGLYQVNVTVPAGVTPGPSVPIVLQEGNFTSPPVTVPIQ